MSKICCNKILFSEINYVTSKNRSLDALIFYSDICKSFPGVFNKYVKTPGPGEHKYIRLGCDINDFHRNVENILNIFNWHINIICCMLNIIQIQRELIEFRKNSDL